MQVYEKNIDVLGAPLHVRVWGSPSARHQLLYWHGRGGTGLSINEAALTLMEHYSTHVISIDAPGCGQSPARDADAYLMPQLARLVTDLADTLELASLVFVGHSWGGMVGCHVAALYPQLVKRLVLLDTGYLNPEDRGYTSEEAIEDAINLYEGFRFNDWESYLNEEKKHVPRWTEALEAALRTTMQEKNGQIIPIITPHLITSLEHAYVRHPPSTTYPALKESQIPILLLAATLPQSFQPTRERLIARFQAVVPQLEVQYLLETGHDVPSYLGPSLGDYVGHWLNYGKQYRRK
jgi:pimeloyl-ACP methyl ester carboxylesterase